MIDYRPESAIITRGLVAWYDFKIGPLTSVVYDRSQNRRDLTINSAVPSREGFAFAAASSQYLGRTETPPSIGAMHAIGVARVDNIGSVRTLAARWNGSGSRTWIMQTNTSGSLIFNVGGVGQATSPTALATGVWFCWEGYYEPTTAGARLNASGAYGTGSGTHAGQSAAALALGRNDDGPQQYLEGGMGYYLEYTRSLSADEVAHTYTVLRRIMSLRGVALP